LVVAAGATAAWGGAASNASAATKAAFVKSLRADDPNESQIPDSELVVLGGAVCDEMNNGVSVNGVANQFAAGSDGKTLPGLFVSALLVESARYLCPKHTAQVKKWAGVGSASAAASIKPALESVLPPEAKQCTTVPSSSNPPGLVGLVDGIYCNLPKLGADSHLYAYLFDNAADYQTSGSAIFKYEEFNPTPGVGCPTANASQMGGITWGNKSFPMRNGQDLQCLTVAPYNAPAGSTNTIPEYIWTVPSRHIVLEALGNSGSTMKHLDSWWSAHADT